MAVIRQGGRGAGDPPLTIPNREVKPRSADGTGRPGEQGAAPVEGKASEGHLRGLLFFLRHREACPLPPFLLRFVPRSFREAMRDARPCRGPSTPNGRPWTVAGSLGFFRGKGFLRCWRAPRVGRGEHCRVTAFGSQHVILHVRESMDMVAFPSL